jgi:hypothetical protein
MEMLGRVAEQMAAFIILTCLFELMTPNERWRRYLNVLTGLFMLLTLAAPLRNLLVLYPELPDSELPVDSGIWEEEIAGRAKDMRFFWDQSYERELSASVKARLDSLHEGVATSVSVHVDGGEVQEVHIEIGDGQADGRVIQDIRSRIVQWLPVNAGQIKITEASGLEEAR